MTSADFTDAPDRARRRRAARDDRPSDERAERGRRGAARRPDARSSRELRREREARAVAAHRPRARVLARAATSRGSRRSRSRARMEALRRDAKQLIWDLLDVELPIVAAVNGHAMGLGASIALLCDVIFMADTRDDRRSARARRHRRRRRRRRDLAAGRRAGARQAVPADRRSGDRRRGGADRAREPRRARRRARSARRWRSPQRLAAGAPLAVRYTKLAVNKLVKDALNVAFDTSTALELVTFQSEDHQEALAALREKRPPRLQGAVRPVDVFEAIDTDARRPPLPRRAGDRRRDPHLHPRRGAGAERRQHPAVAVPGGHRSRDEARRRRRLSPRVRSLRARRC